MSTEQKEHLKDLLNLPSLEVLEKRRVTLQKGVMLVAGRQYTKADLERQVEQWRLRDAIQATRAEGCFCLGLGGRGHKVWHDGTEEPEEYCGCPDGIHLKDELSKLKAEHLETRRKNVKETQWRAAQIPLRFSEMRLDTSPLNKTQPNLIHRLKEPRWTIPEGQEEPTEEQKAQWRADLAVWGGSWFFYGAYGTGKTGLAVGLARARLTVGRTFASDTSDSWGTLGTILFTTVPAMLGELRSTYGRHEEGKPTEQEVLSKYIEADLLILDDLGAEQVKDTGWVEDRLYQVIGERHDELRSTIFTSNLSLEQLALRIGERIAWRIAEMCGPANIVEVKGDNLRAKL